MVLNYSPSFCDQTMYITEKTHLYMANYIFPSLIVTFEENNILEEEKNFAKMQWYRE